MEIRKLQKTEIPELLELYRHYTFPENIPVLSEEKVSEIWERIDSSWLISYFVGVEDGGIVASCILSITPSFIRGGDGFGVIEHVVTHGEYRRRGYGTAIVRHALEYAWENGCSEVLLLSGSTNINAHKMYTRIGFDENRKKGFVIYRTNPD